MSAEASPSRSEHASALAPGTRLNEFELQQILGVGGFGIVYQAFDHALEREVAIKEYMPASLAGRTETMRVSLRSGSDEESFRLGRESFVKEAKLLARFDHPSLLKVYRYWEANGTAYMAMPILRGRTLKQLRQAQQGPTDEAWLRGLLMPLLGAIETLHRENVFHRDIAPDNIQVEPDGHPVLMDFGAARRVLTDKTQSLTAILKPAYAPIEQYGEAGAVKQGPWTDLYALGATLHYMLLGRPPAPATARTVDDEEVLLTTANLPQCSQGFLLAIQWMLRPRPGDRPQSVAQLREVLEGDAAVPVHSGIAEMRTQLYVRPDGQRPAGPGMDLGVAGGPGTAVDPADLPTLLSPARSAGDVTELLRTDPGTAVPQHGLNVDATVRVPPPPSARADAPAAPAAAAARRSLWPWVVAGLAAVGVAAAVFWPKSEPATAASPPAAAPAAVATPVAAPPAGVGPAVTPPPAGAAPEAAAPASPAPPPGKPVTAVTPAAATEPPPTTAAAPAPAKAPPKANAPAAESRPAVPRPTRAAESAPAPKPPARPAAEPVPVGPGPVCGARSDGVRYLVCMERECATSAFSSHPACAAIRQ
ncbi:MAG: serine/threonine-protein kinase [Burkholderiaceae bacterium]|nr:serine/threonine-protein kinase [Burkholderiaceae bacterium]